MHNLSTVISFEIVRTLKKKSFWIMALVFPLAIGALFAIVFFSNKTTEAAAKATETQKFSIIVKDDSSLIQPAVVTAVGGNFVTDKTAAIDKVARGEVDAFFYYPPAVSKETVETYGRDVGLFDNGRYSAVARLILEQSVSTSVAPDVQSVLGGKVAYRNDVYKDGAVYDGFKQMIAPGVFLILFYILISMFGNQMLSSTTEEKENRVIEMILTTIESRTLIIGKIISLIVLAFIQVVVIMTPVIIAYLTLHDKLSLPMLDLSNIPLDPVRIVIGFLLFSLSFILFTGLLVTIGSATPTAKEAGGFFGVVMLMIFGPLYAVSLFVSAPHSPFVQFLSYFPFTAPIPLMLRNAVGNLSLTEALVALGILAMAAALVIQVAVRVFRYGALEYTRRLSLKEILSRR